jgi:uncharacterized YccA/Bax inhibitor family protein
MNPILPATGAVLGFILVMVAAFKPQYLVICTRIRLFEGLFIGGISAIF